MKQASLVAKEKFISQTEEERRENVKKNLVLLLTKAYLTAEASYGND